jgi:hypothetical protein
MEGLMKWRCPHPDKARQRGCLDIKEEDLCTRKEWNGITYFKAEGLRAQAKAEVYCERSKGMLHEE